MSVRPAKKGSSLRLPERTAAQLDELVRCGRFKNRQTAVAAAVERLYGEEHRHLTARQEAFTCLCGALQLGTTRESLRNAELDRLDWESGQRWGMAHLLADFQGDAIYLDTTVLVGLRE